MEPVTRRGDKLKSVSPRRMGNYILELPREVVGINVLCDEEVKIIF